jgi:cytoskeletal protein CcmA (bactofilin family)
MLRIGLGSPLHSQVLDRNLGGFMRTTNDMQTDPAATGNLNSSASAPRMPAYLGPNLKIKGQIVGDEDLKVDGKVEGPISLGNHRLTAGPNSHILGEIVSREIVIYGEVEGNLRAQDRIEIKMDASVMGELTTSRIIIEDGAYFKGAIGIERRRAKISADANTRLTLSEKDFKLQSVRTAGAGR